MADKVSKEKRSWMMSRIKGKDTKVEVLVRSYLFSKGYRFRKNDKRYPGKPDVVLPKYKTVLFINGCYWHRHPGCKYAQTPTSNVEFWQEKFKKNVANDKRNIKRLEESGWNVITLWECELKKNFDETMLKLESMLRDNI